jgi:hypothetical protein
VGIGGSVYPVIGVVEQHDGGALGEAIVTAENGERLVNFGARVDPGRSGGQAIARVERKRKKSGEDDPIQEASTSQNLTELPHGHVRNRVLRGRRGDNRNPTETSEN